MVSPVWKVGKDVEVNRDWRDHLDYQDVILSLENLEYLVKMVYPGYQDE